MKILVISNGYPTPCDPQLGCFERDQAVALKQLGHEVAVMSVDTRFRWYKRKRGVSVIQEDGLSVFGGYWIPMVLIRGRRIRDRIICHFYDKVYSRLVQEWGKPDILFAHFQRNIYFSLYLKKKYNVPLVGMEHWSVLMQSQLPAFALQRGAVAYSGADKLLSVSRALSESLRQKFNVASEVVNDMLGPEFLEYKPSPREEDAPFRYIAIGTLLPRKGFDLLIKAFAESGLASRGCLLSIIGEGSERSALEQMIAELGLQDSVRLLGRKVKTEIVQALRDSDVFVLSSRAETFGVVCIEAQSQGLPCVATICGGPEEFITEKDGVLIPPENVEELTKAIVYVHDNYSKYDRAEISAQCIGQFSPRVIAKQLTGIFEDVVSNYNEK